MLALNVSTSIMWSCISGKLVMTYVDVQYIPRNMHTVFALLCFVVVIHWLIFPYPSGLLHWHCGNLTIAPVPAKQPWWIWIYTSCEFIINDCITTTKQSTTKPCAYFLGYTVHLVLLKLLSIAKSLLYFITATRDFYTLFLLRIEQKIIHKNYHKENTETVERDHKEIYYYTTG